MLMGIIEALTRMSSILSSKGWAIE